MKNVTASCFRNVVIHEIDHLINKIAWTGFILNTMQALMNKKHKRVSARK